MSTDDAVALLMADHQLIFELFVEYQALDDEEKPEIVADLLRELSTHLSIEESVLYPAIRNGVDRGDELVDNILSKHGDLKEVLQHLHGLRDYAASEACAEQVVRLMKMVTEHVYEQDSAVFPRVRRELSSDELLELATDMRKVKATPHASADQATPSEEPTTELMAKAMAALDHIRDTAKSDQYS